jgi:hypothetical protein
VCPGSISEANLSISAFENTRMLPAGTAARSCKQNKERDNILIARYAKVQESMASGGGNSGGSGDGGGGGSGGCCGGGKAAETAPAPPGQAVGAGAGWHR